jgi:high affinity Mn2+ porin
LNRARLGNYRTAIAAERGRAPDVTAVRLPGAVKYGGGLLVDQQITTDLALFFRAGANDGQTETVSFAEIDRSLSLGGELSGRPWGRASDRLGLGVALSGLSDAHRDYLRAGGVGIQLGDGRLDAGLEYVAEVYYDVHLGKYVEVTPDIQGCVNPGMNRDRGPVALFGLRVHGHL